MNKIAMGAALASLLTGCAAMPTQPAPAATASAAPVAKPACARSDAATGSHIVETRSCNSDSAHNVSGTAMMAGMRQTGQGITNGGK